MNQLIFQKYFINFFVLNKYNYWLYIHSLPSYWAAPMSIYFVYSYFFGLCVTQVLRSTLS